jgi:tripeptidyl-peptidase-1
MTFKASLTILLLLWCFSARKVSPRGRQRLNCYIVDADLSLLTGTNQKDVDLFMNKYRPGVPYDLKLAFGEGLENSPPAEGEFAELTLDIQTAAGIASPIPLRGYVLPASDNTDIAFTSFFDYFINLPDSERPGVASYSFGTEESTEATSSLRIGCQSAKHLTALGTTIFVASGDWGVFGSVKGGSPGISCPPFLPTWPSGCQYVVSVGATAGLQAETAVNEKQHDFWGGGGFSNVFPTPDYQKEAVQSYIESLDGAEDGNYNSTGRAYPDISAIGYMVPTIHAGRLGAQLGTSASSPSAAAIFALLNSARKAAGLGTIGWANPTLYKHPELFVDVTKGKAGGCTDEEGTEHSLPTRPGWDAATGWGSLRFDKRECDGGELRCELPLTDMFVSVSLFSHSQDGIWGRGRDCRRG